MSGTIVLLKIKHWKENYLLFYFVLTLVFGHFDRKFSVIKLAVSMFGQTIGYRIKTASREPIRLPEIQYAVFSI